MILKLIDKTLAKDFIFKYHYSKVLPRITKHHLGFYENDELIGVVTLGLGTQPLQTIRKIFPNHKLESSDYLEIGKMCFTDIKNNDRKSGSMIVSLLRKWIKQNTDVMFLYTLADGTMGKVGYVYQASSFYYIGSFTSSIYIDNNTKEKLHPRSSKQLCIENAKFSGKEKIYWLTPDFCKFKNIDRIKGTMFRYIIPLNTKAKEIFNEYNIVLPYPKDKDLRWIKRIKKGKYVEISQPKFNMDICNLNYQKWD